MAAVAQSHSLRIRSKALAFALALVSLLFPIAGAAQGAYRTTGTRSWRIADFSSDIQVHENGSIDVLEQISFVFLGEWHGIRRFIPVDYPGPDGTNYKLLLTVKNVTDENGRRLDYSLSSQDH